MIPDPETTAPAWTLSRSGDFHVLNYQGVEQSRSRIGSTLREMCALFNRRGTLPKKKGKKIQCAADHADPAKFIAEHGVQSPPLGLERVFHLSALAAVIDYYESLFDGRELGAVAVPGCWEELMERLEHDGEPRRATLHTLRFLQDLTRAEVLETEAWLRWMRDGEGAEIAPPAVFTAWEDVSCRYLQGAGLRDFDLALRYIFNLEQSPQTNKNTMTKTKTAPKKALTAAPVESSIPLVEHIPASQFRRYPSNRQISAAQIEAMSDSIRQVGVLQPITCRPVKDLETGGTDLEIVIGESRWLGCCDIDENYPVPCFVRDLTDKDAAKIHAVENFQRKDLDEIEEARAIQHLRDTGWGMGEIVEFLARSQEYVYKRLVLLKLGEDAHQAIRDGNLTINTAVKLADIPEDQRDDALRAVVSPVHAAKALPEREALKLLSDDFIDPAKRSLEWDNRRGVILDLHPRAKWLAYAEACAIDKWKSGYVATDRKPEYHLLSQAAKEDELLVPTWGELAKKHGAALVIGCSYNDEARTYVLPQPIIDAEKLACAENPVECIFEHEGALHQARESAEQKRQEGDAEARAIDEERMRLVEMILTPDGMNKTSTKKFVELAFMDIAETYCEAEDFHKIFGIDQDEDGSYERADSEVSKYLHGKAMSPWEAMARLNAAAWASRMNLPLDVMFDCGACKERDFPAHHKVYLRMQARRAALSSQEAARAAAATASLEGGAL